MVGIEEMSTRTAEMAKRLVKRGWMIDFAPGRPGEGKMFRVVVNISTLPGTVPGLVKALKVVGQEVVSEGL